MRKYERKKRKLEAFSSRESNVTCRKRMSYNHQSELKSKSVMKMYRQEIYGGAKPNVNHSYGTRLQAKRKREFEFSHEENYGFGKKRKISELATEENGRLKTKKNCVETSDKDVGYMNGQETEADVNERKRKRKSCDFLNKADVRIKEKWNCKESNQAGKVKSPHTRNSTKEELPLIDKNYMIGLRKNESIAKLSLDDESANELIQSIQRMEMANTDLDTNMEEYVHQIKNATFGEDQNVVTENAFQNQILEVVGNSFNSIYYFLEIITNQEDINNNKQTLQQKYEPQFPYKHSCIERADNNMTETVLIIRRLDGKDSTNIGLCNEPFATINSDIYQTQSCIYPSIQDLKIEVGHYEDNDHTSQDLKIEVGHYEDNDHPSQDLKIEVGHYEDNDHPSQDLKIEVGHYEDNDHPSQDLKIEVGHYEDNDHPSQANPTAMGSYIESMDTSVTCTKVTVKQEPVWDDYGKGTTDCTEDNENDNDSEDIDTPGSIRSELRIRPIDRRKRVLVPLRIRLLKTLTMRRAWNENTTCCPKYCWIDWHTATVGQI
ncbi:hypothetical protein CHS0354_015763 [Potamilus streckersoni]|uniref:Uncharacterized protein n=1 Tax=Potamilus streckersoni TaxID=2493646 RepID=A0AAE0T4H8_9BIVA|nr:hypothetical protein CHS0354_015763 [Potamilus streckersoni]